MTIVRLTLLAVATAVLPVTGTPCAAQPVPAAPPLQLDAATGLKEITNAYRAGPTGDRVSITLREGAKTIRRDEFVCRTAPLAADGGRPADVELSLDLGPLRVFASGGMLVVTHVSKAETFFRQDYDPPLTIDKLAAILPPLLLPQLAFAMSVEPPTVMAPYCRGIRWGTATINPADEQPMLSIIGTTERGQRVSLVADGKTGRLRSLSTGLESGSGPSRTLEAAIGTIPVESPSKWMPALSGRRLVSSLDKLIRTVGQTIEPGQRFGSVALYKADHEKARIEDLADAAGEAGVFALVVFDAPDDASLADAAADACTIASIVRQALGGTAAARVVAVLDAGTAISDAVKARATRALAALTTEKDALWTTPRAASLGRLAPDHGAAVVLIGRDMSVRAVIAVMQEDLGEGSTLAERIKEGINGAASPGVPSSQPGPSSPESPSSAPPSSPPASPEPGGG